MAQFSLCMLFLLKLIWNCISFLEAFINYNFSDTRFCAHRSVLSARACTREIVVHVKEWMYTLLIITWYSSRNFTELVLKPLAARMASLFQFWPWTANLFLKIPVQMFLTLRNTIIYLKAVKHLDISLKHLLNETGTYDKDAKDWGSNAVLWLWRFRITVLEIKNTVVVVVLIFLNYNCLCGRLGDSNYFYTEESILCTNFCVCAMLFECTLRTWW